MLLLCLVPWAGRSLAQQPGAQQHRLSTGDVLDVQLFDGTNQATYSVQVDSQGEIVLPLIQHVSVAGLLPREASDLLTERFRTYYHHPSVALAVRSFGEVRVFVFGPDFSGRVIALPTGSHLLDLLNQPSLAPSAMNDRWQEIQQSHATVTQGAGPKGAAGTGEDTGATIESASETNPLYTRGTYRRLHLLRGGDTFDALQEQAPAITTSASNAVTAGGAKPFDESGDAVAVSPAADTAGTTHAGSIRSLSSTMNWRRWIAEQQQSGTQLWVIDPLQITLEGELSRYNMTLADGDVLYIPVPERYVDVEGVAKPGRYELLAEETLGDVLRISGSVETTFDLRNAVVQRYGADGSLQRIVTNIYPGLDDIREIASFKLANRDRIGVFPSEERVFVLGEVNSAGAFSFTEDSTILDYLALAGGDTERAHMAWIAVIRQSRDRLDPGAAPEVLRLNFKEIHKGYPSCSEVVPLPGDIIYVPPKGKDFEVAQVLSAVGTVINGYALIDRLSNSSN
jgi:protein involved in polysaccharide export with SLBB domain